MVVEKLGQADNKSYTVDSTFKIDMPVIGFGNRKRTYCIEKYS